MRFVILGAGAIGGVIGGRLAQHGHDVLLIARGRALRGDPRPRAETRIARRRTRDSYSGRRRSVAGALEHRRRPADRDKDTRHAGGAGFARDRAAHAADSLRAERRCQRAHRLGAIQERVRSVRLVSRRLSCARTRAGVELAEERPVTRWGATPPAPTRLPRRLPRRFARRRSSPRPRATSCGGSIESCCRTSATPSMPCAGGRRATAASTSVLEPRALRALPPPESPS